MKALSSLARKATAPTRSSGAWSRAMERVARERSDWAAVLASLSLFSSTPELNVKPGAIALTVMPSRPISRAMECVMPSSAPLLAT